MDSQPLCKKEKLNAACVSWSYGSRTNQRSINVRKRESIEQRLEEGKRDEGKETVGWFLLGNVENWKSCALSVCSVCVRVSVLSKL